MVPITNTAAGRVSETEREQDAADELAQHGERAHQLGQRKAVSRDRLEEFSERTRALPSAVTERER